MEPSKYQQAIYDWAKDGSGNAFVNAVAGSGKTTTIVQMAQMLEGRLLLNAFNVSIKNELVKRLPDVDVRTMNGLGNSLIPRKKLDKNKTKNFLVDHFGDWKSALPYIKTVVPMISLMKAYGFRPDNILDKYQGLAAKFGHEDVDYDVLKLTWDYHCQVNPSCYDFDDQIWRPVVFGCHPQHYDWVFVDEAQDLNPIMIELIGLIEGRKVFVGDEAQAIYGFRGADEHAVAHIIDRFDCSVHPLSVCYRCGSEIIREAQKIMPTIESHWEGGEVSTVQLDKIEPEAGDLVLCRVTKDLVIGCLGMIRDGKKATIKGREIGFGLKKVYNDGQPDFESYSRKQFRSNEQQLAFDDKCDTIFAIMDYSDDVVGTIDSIFSEDTKGVVFSTIHKAKGLEADNVYIIRPDLLPHPRAESEAELIQERNLKYVAVTRAKHKLIFAEGEYR